MTLLWRLGHKQWMVCMVGPDRQTSVVFTNDGHHKLLQMKIQAPEVRALEAPILQRAYKHHWKDSGAIWPLLMEKGRVQGEQGKEKRLKRRLKEHKEPHLVAVVPVLSDLLQRRIRLILVCIQHPVHHPKLRQVLGRHGLVRLQLVRQPLVRIKGVHVPGLRPLQKKTCISHRMKGNTSLRFQSLE